MRFTPSPRCTPSPRFTPSPRHPSHAASGAASDAANRLAAFWSFPAARARVAAAANPAPSTTHLGGDDGSPAARNALEICAWNCSISVEPGASGSSDRANRAHVARSSRSPAGRSAGAGAVANLYP